jgi:predicted DNA-binding transcriptional regulator AlpA
VEQRRVLRQREAARFLGLAESTVEKLRLTGAGPRFVKLGARAVGYDRDDLVKWIEARKVANTSEKLR